MKREQVIDLYFMEARAKLIDLAAFLDRVDRAPGTDDFRMAGFSPGPAGTARRPAGSGQTRFAQFERSDHRTAAGRHHQGGRRSVAGSRNAAQMN
jgi:hypothetical protein